MRRARHHLLAPLILFALLTTTARAENTATLHVTFAPYVLGHSTNVTFDVHIQAPPGRIPPPLTGLDVLYPSTLGLDVSGLGINTCRQALLEELGPIGCPAESFMGRGTAVAEFAIGAEILHETAEVSIIRAPESQGRIAMYFNLAANTPVSAQFVLDGELLPGTNAYERIHLDIPLIPTYPGAPDVAVVGLSASFGPRSLTYYEHIHGKLVPYKPQGILLPNRCPRDSFSFIATLSFANGTSTTTTTHVPCKP